MKILRRSYNTFLAFCLLSIAVMTTASAEPFGELLTFWDDYEESSTVKVDHTLWQEILNEYLNDQDPSGVNLFDYAGVSEQDKGKLDSYLEYLQSIDPRQLNKSEQLAFWINIYNSTTVQIVTEQIDEIDSIRDIRSGIFSAGPWDLELLNIAGQDLSLNHVEHGILRPIWRDSRIHYAVNCASFSCPNLLKSAFTAENTEALFEEGARAYINHKRGVSINGNDLVMSSIFNWYGEDFGNNFQELVTHLKQYANPELASRLETFSDADYDYDWSLNN